MLLSPAPAIADPVSDTFAAPASGPILEAGSVSAVTASGALPAATPPSLAVGGVAVIGSSAFVVDGTRLAQVDKGSGAVLSSVGTAGSNVCADASSAAAVRFAPKNGGVRMAGTDGRYIYVIDGCGVRRVDPATGAANTISSTWFKWSAIAGRYLYGLDDSRNLFRLDLAGTAGLTYIGKQPDTGAIAADDSAVWLFGTDSNALYRIDAVTGARAMVTLKLPASQPASTLLSVGDYLYAGLRSPWQPYYYSTLVRIGKSTGTTRLITLTATGTASPSVSSLTGIASDNTNLYLTDVAEDGTTLKSVAASAATPFVGPASGPVIETGLVSTLSMPNSLPGNDLASSMGVGGLAVLDRKAYVADDTRIVRINTADGSTSTLAGVTGNTSCADATTGFAARFVAKTGGIRIVGTDGHYIYVSDYCGLRRIEPATGATTTLTKQWYRWTSIAGNLLYAADDVGNIVRYDLAGVSTPTEVAQFYDPYVNPASGAIAADQTDVYVMDPFGQTVYQFNSTTGSRSILTTHLPANQPASAMLSVGDYLYASLRSTASPYYYTTLVRISKETGAWRVVAGMNTDGHTDGGYVHAQFNSINGIAVDGDNLLISDSSKGQSSLRAARTPQVAFAETPFIPLNNAPPDLMQKSVLWDPSTKLCTNECDDVHRWAQLKYEEGGDYNWWHAFWCSTNCMPDDYERDLIETMVDVQGMYNIDGTLRQDYVADNLTTAACFENAAKSFTACTEDAINQASAKIKNFAQSGAEMAAFLANLPGGTRPQLNDEQQAAKTRYEELAKKSCDDNPRLPGEQPTVWGTRVHKYFESLLQQERSVNPKMHGENGYFAGGPTTARVKGSSFPDGVYGVDPMQPEMFFDLKTGLKLISPRWVLKLSGNLPQGTPNVPVFYLHC